MVDSEMTATLAQSIVQFSSVASTIGSGFASMSAGNSEASALRQQGAQARTEAMRDANVRVREVGQFRERQAMQYTHNGVSLAGSPLLVLEETRRLGQEEVDSLIQRGDAMDNLYRTKAAQAKSTGRMAFLASLTRAGSTGYGYLGQSSGNSSYPPASHIGQMSSLLSTRGY